MRLSQCSKFGLVFGSGLAVAGAFAGIACGGDGFKGCEASRSCPLTGAGNGGGPSAGRGGVSAGGKAGQGGNEATGGSGVTGGASGKASAGADDVAGAGDEPASDENAGAPGSHGSTNHGSGGKPSQPQEDGGSDDSAAGMGGASAAPPGMNQTGPTILKVTTRDSSVAWPLDGGTGIAKDADIVIVFSRAMDSASTKAAYQSASLPWPDAVDLVWDDAEDLIIHPKQELEYAAVTDPSAAPRSYSFAIASTAADTLGNQLGAGAGFSFTTLKDVTQSLSVAANSGVTVTLSAGEPNAVEPRCDGSTGAHISSGDDADDDTLVGLLSFDLTGLPATVVEWERVVLSGSLGRSSYNPYTRGLGQLHAYGTSADADNVGWNSGTIDLGAFGEYASQASGNLDVSPAFTLDYGRRDAQHNLSTYLLRFDTATNGDHELETGWVNCAHLALSLEYLTP